MRELVTDYIGLDVFICVNTGVWAVSVGGIVDLYASMHARPCARVRRQFVLMSMSFVCLVNM